MNVRTNTIKVRFGKLNSVESLPLTQWDKGQILEFADAFENGTEVQFSNGCAETINRVIEDSKVEVPDVLLKGTAKIYAWIKVITSDSETTVKEIRIPVTARTKPADYVAPEDEQSFREWAEGVMEETEAIAQSVRDDADDGKFDGKDGEDGEDGVSPTATVTRTSDGVLIKVTDASGTTQAEVKDGKDGTLTPEEKQRLKDEISANVEQKLDIPSIKEDISDLEQNKANSTDVYSKTETYTKEEVDAIVSAVNTGEMVFVEELPSTGKVKTLYMLLKAKTEEGNMYDEYVWLPTRNKFERIGNAQMSITIDSTLSQTSTNPVQNKVITLTLKSVQDDVNANYEDIVALQTSKQDKLIKGSNININENNVVSVYVDVSSVVKKTITKANGNVDITNLVGKELTFISKESASMPAQIIICDESGSTLMSKTMMVMPTSITVPDNSSYMFLMQSLSDNVAYTYENVTRKNLQQFANGIIEDIIAQSEEITQLQEALGTNLDDVSALIGGDSDEYISRY